MHVKKNMERRLLYNKMRNRTKKYFNLNKKAISGIVTAVIMIALVMAAAIIVWVVVNNLVSTQLTEAESCFMIFGKVSINNRYTCYNSTTTELQFSINIGDIKVDEVLVSISGEGTTQSFKISNTDQLIPNLRNYLSAVPETKLPGKNGGSTYIYELTGAGFFMKPDSIKIAPIINTKQCASSDSLSDIDNCLSLA